MRQVVGRGLSRNVRSNNGGCAAVLYSKREDVHALAAHPDAAITQDAARTIEVNHRRPLLLVAVILRLGVEAVGSAVLEGHILQLALAAGIADRAVERMVAEQHLQRSLPCLRNLRGLSLDNHAIGDRRRAGGLQLRHLLNAHHTHAASCLQRKSGIVAKGRNLNSRGLASFNQQRACRGGELFAVYGEFYVWH